MHCAFCGEEFDGRPVRQDGNLYCSASCADMASEAGLGEEELDFDGDSEMNYLDGVEEEEY